MSCFNSTKGTRFIGVFGLVVSLGLINLLAKTDLNLQENIQPTAKILLGLEWRDFVPFEDRSLPKGKGLPLSIFVYAVIHAIANLFLILASITKNGWYTLPWIFTQLTGIICQYVSLFVHCTEYHDYQLHLIVAASSYIVITSYFCIVVLYTQSQWRISDEYTLNDEEDGNNVHFKDSTWEFVELNNHNVTPFEFQTYKEI